MSHEEEEQGAKKDQKERGDECQDDEMEEYLDEAGYLPELTDLPYRTSRLKDLILSQWLETTVQATVGTAGVLVGIATLYLLSTGQYHRIPDAVAAMAATAFLMVIHRIARHYSGHRTEYERHPQGEIIATGVLAGTGLISQGPSPYTLIPGILILGGAVATLAVPEIIFKVQQAWRIVRLKRDHQKYWQQSEGKTGTTPGEDLPYPEARDNSPQQIAKAWHEALWQELESEREAARATMLDIEIRLIREHSRGLPIYNVGVGNFTFKQMPEGDMESRIENLSLRRDSHLQKARDPRINRWGRTRKLLQEVGLTAGDWQKEKPRNRTQAILNTPWVKTTTSWATNASLMAAAMGGIYALSTRSHELIPVMIAIGTAGCAVSLTRNAVLHWAENAIEKRGDKNQDQLVQETSMLSICGGIALSCLPDPGILVTIGSTGLIATGIMTVACQEAKHTLRQLWKTNYHNSDYQSYWETKRRLGRLEGFQSSQQAFPYPYAQDHTEPQLWLARQNALMYQFRLDSNRAEKAAATAVQADIEIRIITEHHSTVPKGLDWDEAQRSQKREELEKELKVALDIMDQEKSTFWQITRLIFN